MNFYGDAHLVVLAARAGCPVSRDSAMGQALERLKIRRNEAADPIEKSKRLNNKKQ